MKLTMLTDLYQLSMAQGYWTSGKLDTRACFYMFFRENPFKGGYSVACGIEQVARLVDEFGFDEEDIAYLSSLLAPAGGPLFEPAFLEYLLNLKLSVDIDAVLEGEIVFPREPIVRVSGPIMQCQLLETALLNGVNFQTLIATKAARVCDVAGGPVAEFGLRRAQGPDGGVSASRASYIGGCASTSNVLAGQLYGIPVSGTHAHSWVMSFDSELEAFRAYATMSPTNCTLLVDTYDVLEGVKNAIIIAHEMEQRGQRLSAIRIDSGDLAWLSKQARALLDEAGLSYVGIVASNNLDEYTISSLREQGAAITAWGVGTRLATANDQPALGGVYKLSAIYDEKICGWDERIKATEQAAKATLPGVLDVRRYVRDDGSISGDMIFDVNKVPYESERIFDPLDSTRSKDLSGRAYTTLLKPLARAGKVVREAEPIERTRARALEGIAALDDSIKRLLRPHNYPVGVDYGLMKRRDMLLLSAKGHIKKALILVDIQNDFCEGGALAVAGAHEVVAVANELIARFAVRGLPIYATRDWHPAHHASFASSHEGAHVGDVIQLGDTSQYLWPDHCVQGTTGSEFHPELDAETITHTIFKGTDERVDSYSAFFDNDHASETGLGAVLARIGVKELWICGLATDYCVKYTALDACALGFDVSVIAPACRGVEAVEGDCEAAFDAMREAGCTVYDTLPKL